MAFPATADNLARALLDAQNEARAIKTYSADAVTLMAGNNVSANQVLDIYARLGTAKAKFQAVAAVSGIGQYAKDQFANQSLDVVAEFNAMVAAVDYVRSWIETNHPKDPSGYLLKDQFSGGSISVRSFTPAQTAGLRTALSSLVAAID